MKARLFLTLVVALTVVEAAAQQQLTAEDAAAIDERLSQQEAEIKRLREQLTAYAFHARPEAEAPWSISEDDFGDLASESFVWSCTLDTVMEVATFRQRTWTWADE